MLFTLKDIIYIFLIAECLLFALMSFIFKNMRSKHGTILGVFMMLMSFFFAVTFIYNRQNIVWITHIHYLLLPMFLAINPFYYIYLKSLTSENFRFNWKLTLHYIPAIVILICMLAFYLPLTNSEKIDVVVEGINNTNRENPLIRLNVLCEYVSLVIYYIQIILYFVFMAVVLRKHSLKIHEYFSYTKKVSLDWLKIFLAIFFINGILEFSIAFLSGTPYFSYLEIGYYIFLVLFFSFLGFFGIKQTDIYSFNFKEAYKEKNDDSYTEKPLSVESRTSTQHAKYAQSAMSEEMKIQLKESVKLLIEEEKFFLNPELSIEDIATALKTNKTYISQVINEVYNKNFLSYINEYRVNEVKKLLKSDDHKHLSLEGIASLSGFNSRFVLNSAFKKITGQSPTVFRNSK